MLSYPEELAKQYYTKADELEVGMRGKKLHPLRKSEWGEISKQELEILQAQFEARKKALAGFFINAVDTHNWQAIQDVASAVYFFKNKRRRTFTPMDSERMKLLELKKILLPTNVKLTVKQVATIIAVDAFDSGKPLQPSEDGYSALRRKCKELGFPLEESRRGRPKKKL